VNNPDGSVTTTTLNAQGQVQSVVTTSGGSSGRDASKSGATSDKGSLMNIMA
jgi:YD repeat-containing protein